MKPTKCFNCKEPTQENDGEIKVRFRGKIRTWCRICWQGYFEEKSSKKI